LRASTGIEVGPRRAASSVRRGHREPGQGFGVFELRSRHFQPGVVHRLADQGLLQQARAVHGEDEHGRVLGPVVAQRLHQVGGVDRLGVHGAHAHAHRGEFARAVPHGLVAQCKAVQHGVARHHGKTGFN